MQQLRLLPLVLIMLAFAGCKSQYEKGMQAFQEGRWKESIKYFNEVKGWDKHSEDAERMAAKACFNFGKDALAAGNWDEALEYLPKAKTDRYAEAKDMMDQARLARGKEAIARKEWSAALNDFLLVTPESSRHQEARALIARVKELRSS